MVGFDFPNLSKLYQIHSIKVGYKPTSTSANKHVPYTTGTVAASSKLHSLGTSHNRYFCALVIVAKEPPATIPITLLPLNHASVTQFLKAVRICYLIVTPENSRPCTTSCWTLPSMAFMSALILPVAVITSLKFNDE